MITSPRAVTCQVIAIFQLMVLSFPRIANGAGIPSLQVDPDTISPCYFWEDNANDLVCEDIRKEYGITPEEFSRWNPSVGLDCKPWRVQAYCVAIVELPEPDWPSSTATKPSTATSTSSTSSLGPSPTAWTAMGCYTDENPKYSAMDKRLSKDGGDDSLTIAKCQDMCYKAAFYFAGVKDGRECWCGQDVLSDWADKATECNSPCSGNKSEVCGGKARLNVFEPKDDWLYDDIPSQDGEQGGEDDSDDKEANDNQGGKESDGKDEKGSVGQTEDSHGSKPTSGIEDESSST